MSTVLNKNKLIQFINWWAAGLCLPFQQGVRKALVLDCDADQLSVRTLLSDTAEPLTKQHRAAINKTQGTRAFLSIPSEELIVTSIPNKNRDLPLAEIAALLLPFGADELLVGTDSQKQRIYAVLKSQVEEKLRLIRAANIPLSGLAVIEQNEFSCIDVEPLARMHSRSSLKPWALAIGVLMVVLIIAASFSWFAQTSEQDDLRQVLKEYQLAGQSADGHDLPTLKFGIYKANALQRYRLLRNLLDALPNEAVVDQLTLNLKELLLDMRAPSASLVKSKLDTGKNFSSSEFISAISNDPRQNQERFRLQLKLATPPEYLSEREVQGDE